MKIPHFAGRKFPTPEAYKAASLALDAVEPSAVFWRVLGVTEFEAKGVGRRSLLFSGWHQSGLASLFQPIALAADVNRRRVMQQPVQNRCRDDRVPKDRTPVSVALVRSQNDAASFVTRADQLEEDRGSQIVQR